MTTHARCCLSPDPPLFSAGVLPWHNLPRLAQTPASAPSATLRELQQLRRLHFKGLGEPTDDLQAGVERPLLQLAQIAPAHPGLIGEIVLRDRKSVV